MLSPMFPAIAGSLSGLCLAVMAARRRQPAAAPRFLPAGPRGAAAAGGVIDAR
jgi:hypothetical protein